MKPAFIIFVFIWFMLKGCADEIRSWQAQNDPATVRLVNATTQTLQAAQDYVHAVERDYSGQLTELGAAAAAYRDAWTSAVQARARAAVSRWDRFTSVAAALETSAGLATRDLSRGAGRAGGHLWDAAKRARSRFDNPPDKR